MYIYTRVSVCLCTFVHACNLSLFLYLCKEVFYSYSVSTLAGFSCLLLNHKSPATLPTSQHISACKLFATFFIQVSVVTAPLSLLASWLQHVSGSKHKLVQGTWSAYQSTDVSAVQKRIKTIWKNKKSGVSLPRRTKVTCWTRWLTKTWHMHLTMTPHLDICIVCLRDHLYCQKAMKELKSC